MALETMTNAPAEKTAPQKNFKELLKDIVASGKISPDKIQPLLDAYAKEKQAIVKQSIQEVRELQKLILKEQPGAQLAGKNKTADKSGTDVYFGDRTAQALEKIKNAQTITPAETEALASAVPKVEEKVAQTPPAEPEKKQETPPAPKMENNDPIFAKTIENLLGDSKVTLQDIFQGNTDVDVQKWLQDFDMTSKVSSFIDVTEVKADSKTKVAEVVLNFDDRYRDESWNDIRRTLVLDVTGDTIHTENLKTNLKTLMLQAVSDMKNTQTQANVDTKSASTNAVKDSSGNAIKDTNGAVVTNTPQSNTQERHNK